MAAVCRRRPALVKHHPGYYIGEFGQPWDAETYLWGNECPINKSLGNQTLLDNPSSSNCTTIAHLIDSALRAFTHNGPFTTAWVKDKTAQHMVMDFGAIWQGIGHLRVRVEHRGSRDPRDGGLPAAGGDQWGACHRLDRRWAVVGHVAHHPGEGCRGIGGILHTSPKIQENPAITQGMPAYRPDQSGWLKSLKGVFANSAATAAAIKKAASEIWNGWSPVPWSVEAIFGNTCTPGLVAGGTFTPALKTLAGNIQSAAQSAGWQVKT